MEVDFYNKASAGKQNYLNYLTIILYHFGDEWIYLLCN